MLKKSVFTIVLLVGVMELAGCGLYKAQPIKEQPRLKELAKRTFRDKIETEKFKCEPDDPNCISIDEDDNKDDKVVTETDYIIKTIVEVRNEGGDGKVRADVTLKTAEGTFYKKQIIEIEKGEDRTLEFVFDEADVLRELDKYLQGESLKVDSVFSWETVADNVPLSPNKKGKGVDINLN
jgi:hypothetical protein